MAPESVYGSRQSPRPDTGDRGSAQAAAPLGLARQSVTVNARRHPGTLTTHNLRHRQGLRISMSSHACAHTRFRRSRVFSLEFALALEALFWRVSGTIVGTVLTCSYCPIMTNLDKTRYRA